MKPATQAAKLMRAGPPKVSPHSSVSHDTRCYFISAKIVSDKWGKPHNLQYVSCNTIEAAMKSLWSILSLGIGALAAVAFNSTLATNLGLPTWLTFVAMLLDVSLVLTIPTRWPTYRANINLVRRGWTSQYADYPLGVSYLLIILTVLVPVICLLWFALTILK